MPRMQKATPIAGAGVLLFALLFVTAGRLHLGSQPLGKKKEVLLVPPSDIIRQMDLGYHTLAADLLLIRASQILALFSTGCSFARCARLIGNQVGRSLLEEGRETTCAKIGRECVGGEELPIAMLGRLNLLLNPDTRCKPDALRNRPIKEWKSEYPYLDSNLIA